MFVGWQPPHGLQGLCSDFPDFAEAEGALACILSSVMSVEREGVSSDGVMYESSSSASAAFMDKLLAFEEPLDLDADFANPPDFSEHFADDLADFAEDFAVFTDDFTDDFTDFAEDFAVDFALLFLAEGAEPQDLWLLAGGSDA